MTSNLKYIVFVLSVFVGLSFPVNAKIDSNIKLSRQRAIDVETFYKIGDYKECSLIGDTIYEVENFYDAIALGYSAMANHKLAFRVTRKRQSGLVDPVYSSNFTRANFKAQDTYNYLLRHISELSDFKNNKTDLFLDRLKAYMVGVECCRILQNKKQFFILEQLNECQSSVSLKFRQKNVALETEMRYIEILYNLEKREYDKVIDVLVPQFESFLSSNLEIDHTEISIMATIFNQLSEYCNYFAMENREEDSRLITLSVNLLIHSRDYSLFAKGGTKDFVLYSWKELQPFLDEGSKACLFFVYARSSDSWNYIWCFDDKSEAPVLEYGGHSYWSENQGMEGLYRDFADCKKLFVVCTMDMTQTDFANDDRVVRLHSLSDLVKTRAVKWDESRPVTTVGNINFSSHTVGEESGTAEYKGHREGAKKFASAEREIRSMRSIFGSSLTIYQGDSVTKNTFFSFNPDMSILHISTHGVFNKDLLRKLNRQNPVDGMTGDNILKSCLLKLSGYNDDEIENTISAFEIKDLILENTDIVFISACESGAGQSLNFGDFSMAESFHIAGAKNIIAVIDPIKEETATRFAECLYSGISSGKTYHDAFYEAKIKICPSVRIILLE